MNTLEYAIIFMQELDRLMIQASTSGWMEPNSDMIQYNGGSEVRIATVATDGLGDYDRSKGYPDGAVTLKYKPYTMSQDRGQSFMLDAMDVNETNFIANASNVIGEFQRTHVVPEVDSYRYSRIAQLAIDAKKARGGYGPAEATILKELTNDIVMMQDIIGDGIPLVIIMSAITQAILSNNDKISKRLDVSDFTQGGINTKVKSLDGTPIISVPSARLKTKYVFYNEKSEGDKKSGFEADPDAKTINWLIVARTAPIAVSKTDTVRIFDPATNQKAHAWKIDYRKYHDLWVMENKKAAIFANIKEAIV